MDKLADNSIRTLEDLERGKKLWSAKTIRRALTLPPGVQVMATRYDPRMQAVLCACTDGVVRPIPWNDLEACEDVIYDSDGNAISSTEIKRRQEREEQLRKARMEQDRRDKLHEDCLEASNYDDAAKAAQAGGYSMPDKDVWEEAEGRLAEFMLAKELSSTVCEVGSCDRHGLVLATPSLFYDDGQVLCAEHAIYAHQHDASVFDWAGWQKAQDEDERNEHDDGYWRDDDYEEND